jgi:hypothetical protein
VAGAEAFPAALEVGAFVLVAGAVFMACAWLHAKRELAVDNKNSRLFIVWAPCMDDKEPISLFSKHLTYANNDHRHL